MKAFDLGIDFTDVQSTAPQPKSSAKDAPRSLRHDAPSSASSSASSSDRNRSKAAAKPRPKSRKKSAKERKKRKKKKAKKKRRGRDDDAHENHHGRSFFINRKRRPSPTSSPSRKRRKVSDTASSHRYFTAEVNPLELLDLSVRPASQSTLTLTLTLNSDIIPLPPSTPTDAATTTGKADRSKTFSKSSKESVARSAQDEELREVNERLEQCPTDEEAWVEKIVRHVRVERARAASRKGRRGFNERLLSIYDKALRNVPRSVQLHVGRLRVLSELRLERASVKEVEREGGDGDEVLREWYLWMKELRYHPLICQGFVECVSAVGAPIAGTVPFDVLKREMITVFVNCARYWRMDEGHFLSILDIFEHIATMYSRQGFKEIAIACFQALFEFTSDAPTVAALSAATVDPSKPIETPLELFKDFWESDFPRAGEDAPASGWAAWYQAVYPMQQTTTELADMVADIRLILRGQDKQSLQASGDISSVLLAPKKDTVVAEEDAEGHGEDSEEELEDFNLDQLRRADDREFAAASESNASNLNSQDMPVAPNLGLNAEEKRGEKKKFYVYSPIHGRRIFVGSKDEETVAVNSSEMYLSILKDLNQDELVFPEEFKHSSKTIHEWTRAEAREEHSFHAPIKTSADSIAALEQPQSVPFAEEVLQLLFPVPEAADAARAEVLRHFLRHVGLDLPFRFPHRRCQKPSFPHLFHPRFLYTAVCVEGLSSFRFHRNSGGTFIQQVLLRGVERFGDKSVEFMTALIWLLTHTGDKFSKTRAIAKRMLSFVEETRHACRFQAWVAFAEAESVKGRMVTAQKIYNKVMAAAVLEKHADTSRVAFSFARFKLTLLLRGLCLNPANTRNRIIRTFASASTAQVTTNQGFHRLKASLRPTEVALCRQGFNERCNHELKVVAEEATVVGNITSDVPVFAYTLACFAWFECYEEGFGRAREVLQRGRKGLKAIEASRKQKLPDVRAGLRFLLMAEMDMAIHQAYARFQAPQRSIELREVCIAALEEFPCQAEFVALALHLAGSVQVSLFWEQKLANMMAEAEVEGGTQGQREGAELLFVGVAALDVWRFHRRTNHIESLQMITDEMKVFPREDQALAQRYQQALRRLRGRFKRALASRRVSQSPTFWKLYARLELTAGRFKAARKVLFKALESCQWHKDLWVYAIYCISGKAEGKHTSRTVSNPSHMGYVILLNVKKKEQPAIIFYIVYDEEWWMVQDQKSIHIKFML